ncbi:carbohydrate-binding protein [Herbivorax sp. ANBcel31]|uniref:carbohydrate-binding protein n=1 Tax=Herbivorax sp. ANBcel31 TaxID=3069754 RepID=UPI0027B04644|nr:carbohydrate-binding protein [Herbivorax sp. ANBcel31]MDQ2085235.1 carbohydrate-binding protein [Herbivorax sp. ANBcel31]
MGFLDFLFNKTKKADIKDNNLLGPTDIAPADVNRIDHEFSEDLATENSEAPKYEENNSYSQSGVYMQNAQKTFKLLYDGILSKNGSDEIHAIVGYGNNLNWEDVEEHPMSKTKDNKFELMFTVKRPGNINIAFKDNAEHWDNNSGHNYNFENYVC